MSFGDQRYVVVDERRDARSTRRPEPNETVCLDCILGLTTSRVHDAVSASICRSLAVDVLDQEGIETRHLDDNVVYLGRVPIPKRGLKAVGRVDLP